MCAIKKIKENGNFPANFLMDVVILSEILFAGKSLL
jgi:hypothetical protein